MREIRRFGVAGVAFLSNDADAKGSEKASSTRQLFHSLCRVVLKYAANHCSQLWGRAVSRRDNLFDVHWLGVVGVTHVGDDREAECAEAAVDGDDCFGNRAHADNVGSDPTQEPVFGAGFKIWTGYGD